jgi:hypothetical protein
MMMMAGQEDRKLLSVPFDARYAPGASISTGLLKQLFQEQANQGRFQRRLDRREKTRGR